MSDDHLSDAIFSGQDDGATATRGARPRKRRRGPAAVILSLLLVVGALALAAMVLVPKIQGFLDGGDYAAGDAGKKVAVTVPDNATGTVIGNVLTSAGVVKSTKAFVAAAKDNPRAQSIQPGVYDLPQHIPAKEAVAYLVDPAHRVVKRVTIREGMRATDVYAALSKASGIPVASYEKAAKDPAAIGLPAAAQGNVEGWLFPSSYEFKPKSTATEQLSALVGKTQQVLADNSVPADKAERTLILASIVEAESRLDADRGKVARVLENRLAKPMRLQLDSTVAYATGKRVITTTDAERAQVNGYNTYTRDGLPVGPIGNPGLASIKAALNPTPGNWLYFVTIDPATGETVFTDSLAEHDRAVQKFQQWCQAHKGQC